MKRFVYFFLLPVMLASCTGQKKLATVGIKEPEANNSDSTEYQLIILDTGFESWFMTHSRPEWYHSQDYYENWNRQYVSAWNDKSMSARYGRLFETTINYEPFVDYGLEINHKLFYYFLYVEKELKIQILPWGYSPRGVP